MAIWRGRCCCSRSGGPSSTKPRRAALTAMYEAVTGYDVPARGLSEALELVELLERLTRAKAVGVDVASAAISGSGPPPARPRRRTRADRRARRRSRRSRRARLRAWRAPIGARDDRRRQAGKLGDRDAVAAVGGAVGDFVEQDEVALPLARADMMERQRSRAVRRGGSAHDNGSRTGSGIGPRRASPRPPPRRSRARHRSRCRGRSRRG